jgi:hypothetical protein
MAARRYQNFDLSLEAGARRFISGARWVLPGG